MTLEELQIKVAALEARIAILEDLLGRDQGSERDPNLVDE